MRLVKIFLLLLLVFNAAVSKNHQPEELKLFTADNPAFQFTGRVDFADPLKPRFWSPGVYITAKFKGSDCVLLINDEVLYGNSHNYIEIAIDNLAPTRIQTTGKVNEITVAHGLSNAVHTITICKDTESGIGYLDFVGLRCENLLPAPQKPKRKVEYIGDSITAGTGMDQSVVACDKGQWYDQHNAYMSYGPVTSRALNAQWQLTAVAGIGMIHSCCDMKILMPQVFDKVNLRNDSLKWAFDKYQPDVVTICLGQNDGIQDSVKYCSAYVAFIKQVRKEYAKANIICLTSPMGDEKLTAALKNYLSGITAFLNSNGDQKVSKFFFSKRYFHGCGTHPDMEEHQQMAAELTAYIRKVESW